MDNPTAVSSSTGGLQRHGMSRFLIHACTSNSHIITNQYCSISIFINMGICSPLYRVVLPLVLLLLLFNLVPELGLPTSRTRSFLGLQLPLLSSYNLNFPFVRCLKLKFLQLFFDIRWLLTTA